MNRLALSLLVLLALAACSAPVGAPASAAPAFDNAASLPPCPAAGPQSDGGESALTDPDALESAPVLDCMSIPDENTVVPAASRRPFIAPSPSASHVVPAASREPFNP